MNQEFLTSNCENAREMIIQEHSWNKVAEKVLDICNKSMQ
jgi:hypothetical protein